MQKIAAYCGVALLCLAFANVDAQTVDSITDKAIRFPARFLSRIQSRAAGLNDQLSRQTQRYLQKIVQREEKLRQKITAVDPAGAQQLFNGSAERYAALAGRLKADSGGTPTRLNGVYQPYLDSLEGLVGFLKQNPQLVSSGKVDPSRLEAANSGLQAIQAKMQDADFVKAFAQQRQQQIGAFISQHADLQSLLGKPYAAMKQDVYYYSQQLREYKEMWSHPDQLEQRALGLLDGVPAFQDYMKKNSQLAGLFHLPANYGKTASLSGLQTNDQVAEQLQKQVKSGGAGGTAGFQSSLQSAHSALDAFKNKLSVLGAGNGNADMPDFKPNDQKTKTFWRRLEYGFNFQTSRNNYLFPNVTDFGLSLGYKLGRDNVAGIGASYKLGWGNGIQHIAFSSQGIGLRSFLQIKLKGSFSASGGFEYNYTTPFASYQQLPQLEYWTKSGLIGVTKTVSTKSRVFKKTTLSLLWDFLSYQAVPRTQPVLFRIGYQP